jgi:sialate O-acetylesterase
MIPSRRTVRFGEGSKKAMRLWRRGGAGARLLALSLFGASSLSAGVRPAAVFSDHMVLQQGRPVPIWGTARPGQEVVVEFSGQRKSTKAGRDGRWHVELHPLPAASEGRDLVVSSTSAESLTLTDVLVGEVWLCSGQSNMAWTVREAGISVKNATEEVAAANYPLIRQLKVPKANSREPATGFSAKWTVCSPAAVGGFSGVAYFFARDLLQKLNVPIGILNASYSGTPIEAWLSKETFATDPACTPARERFAETEKNWPEMLAAYRAEKDAWNKEAEAAKAAGTKPATAAPRQPVGPGHPYSPVTVYNAMLHPLIPYALRGVIWYQGEGNVKHAEEYQGLFAALIKQWRGQWGQGEFPFYFVQLANFKGDRPEPNWPWLREAQAKTLALPNTGMAVTIDIGDANDIHPRNKQDVGRRLAALALAKTYGKNIVEISGPVMTRGDREGGAFVISFDHAGGLHLKGEPQGFLVAGADRVFHPAEARIQNEKLYLTSAMVKEPVAARYAWENAPVACLFNEAGLPAAPFRTDTWPREKTP